MHGACVLLFARRCLAQSKPRSTDAGSSCKSLSTEHPPRNGTFGVQIARRRSNFSSSRDTEARATLFGRISMALSRTKPYGEPESAGSALREPRFVVRQRGLTVLHLRSRVSITPEFVQARGSRHCKDTRADVRAAKRVNRQCARASGRPCGRRTPCLRGQAGGRSTNANLVDAESLLICASHRLRQAGTRA